MPKKVFRTKEPQHSRRTRPPNELLMTEAEVATMLRVSQRTLQAWRFSGAQDLPFIRISKRAIRYRRADVERFVEQGLRQSTSDPGGQ